MKKDLQIFVAIRLKQREKAHLIEATTALSLVFAQDMERSQRAKSFMESQICFGNVRPEWLNQTQHLQWIQLQSVGFGKYQHLEPQANFAMTNLHDFFTIPVAESALAGILSLYRGLDRVAHEKQTKTWFGNDLRPGFHLLQEKKVLILGGAGKIGQHLIKLLNAFEAEISVYGTSARNADVFDDAGLDRALAEVDIIVNLLPGTNKTEGLLDRRRLALLKPEALFINGGRGSVVDEEALVEVLRQKKIGGAMLDVTYQEPLPQDHPLWNCPNTILSQHTAGGYEDEILDIVKVFLNNLNRFVHNEPLKNVVDLKKGY